MGILQFLKGRHGAENAKGYAGEKQDDQSQECSEDNPEISDSVRLTFYGFLFLFITRFIHILLSFNEYSNIGDKSAIDDKAYNGGIITNHEIPKTGDHRAPAVWMALMAL